MNPCGLIDLVCSVPGCDVAFQQDRVTPDELHEPLCPRHKKARAVQDDEQGCDEVGGLADA